jgi:hypothetical protein
MHELSTIRNTGSVEKQWYDLMKDYFNVDLDSETNMRWWSEIKNVAAGISNSVVCNAIRNAACTQELLPRVGKPTVMDLTKWVKIILGRRSTQNEPKAKLSHDEFMDKLQAMKRAIDYGAKMEDPHDKMYNTICSGYTLGGIQTCETLERYAVNTHGFDREKITWLPEYKAKLKEFASKLMAKPA